MRLKSSGKKVAIILLVLSTGCTTIPSVRVWRPWKRVMNSHEIQLGAALRTEVNGQTEPLIGSEQLVAHRINEIVNDLLLRRGFRIMDDSYDYDLQVSYRTERHDRQISLSAFRSYSANRTAFSTTSVSGINYGLGVSIAREVGLLSMRMGSTALQVSGEVEQYVHIIATEIYEKQGGLLWKGETTWESENADIFLDLTPKLQLIFSNLPSDPEHFSEVEEIKPGHVFNYYRLECYRRWFSCPALPYRISFKLPPGRRRIAPGINNPIALCAYVDLIQTAEYALPQGTSDWENPLDLKLWARVLLGGEYLLGPSKKPVNVLIELAGRTEGYYISKCWLASDTEYADFEGKISRWKETVREYYDVFQH